MKCNLCHLLLFVNKKKLYLTQQKKPSTIAVLLVAICCLCAIQFSHRQARAFDTDKLYRYEFEGAITTKVADDDKPQYAGYALTSPLLVKRTGSDELTVQLEQPKSGAFNDVIEEIHLYQYQYQDVNSSQAPSLNKPFRIYYEDGAVKSFDTYKDEPKWVTNLKRGLLSFFQLKLNPTQQEQQPTTTSGNQYYTTTEKSVFGECETDYLVMSGGDSSTSYLNVTKTRNMAKCKTRFLHRFMPIDSSECYENEKELQQYKHSNAIFNFDLTGTREKYVIQQAILDEVSTFSPFGQKAHSHLVHSKFMIKLMKTEESGSISADSSESTKIESLSYDPPELLNFYANVNLDEAHHLSNIYQISATVGQVMNAFDALVMENRKYGESFEAESAGGRGMQSSRLAEFFMKLNELVGTLDAAKIESLYSQVDEKGEAHKRIFWDLMSVTGTNPSFMFMKKLITEGDAPSVRIRDFLTRLSYHIKMPSKSLFDEYVNLCKSDKIQANPQYKRLCSLPLASLIHQHCAKPHAKYLRMQAEGANATAFKKAQNTCQIATAEEYFSRLISPWAQSSTGGGSSLSSSSSSSSSDKSSSSSSSSGGSSPTATDELSVGDKMFQIKLAGELGVKPSVEFLNEIINNRDEHPSLRAAAMWNLQKASRIYPNLIKRLAVPRYYDANELLEVRIAAFYNWFFSGLTLHEMETLAKQLQSEPSRQLVVYIHSMVKSLAELNSFPCTNSAEKNAKLVLPAIKKALKRHSYATATDSHASFSSTWNPEFGYGTATLMSAIFSNESMAPTNLFYSSSEIMSGLKLSPMTISVQAHGLDKLMKRVMGINGLLADKESFMDIFSLKRRSKRQTSPDLIKQEAAEIDKELKLATRDFSDVYLAVTVSAYGRPITFFDKDSRELKKMLSEDGTIKIPQIKKLLHSFNNHTTQQMMISFEKLEVFNNELGLPIYQSIGDFDYKTFKLNSVKIDVEPGFFREERANKPPTKLMAALDSKMGRHNEMFVSTGALMPHTKQQVGVGIYKKKLVNVPIKMSVEANLADNKITIKRQPIHDDLLYIKQYPLTFTNNYDPAKVKADGSRAEGVVWRPLYSFNSSSQMKPFKLEYMTPLAVGLRVEGFHRNGGDWSMAAWRRYLNSVGLQAAKFMYTYSPTGAPLEVCVSTATTQENPTKELVSEISWRHYSHESEGQVTSETDKELESFTSKNQQDGTKPTTVNYKLALIGGSNKERKVGIDISYSRSFDRLAHKWRAFYSRTPLDQSATNSEVTNLCWLGSLQFPKYNVNDLLKFDLLNKDHSANMTSDIIFGDECSESKVAGAPSRASARVTFDWSKEQRDMIESALSGKSNELVDTEGGLGTYSTGGRKNPYLGMFKRCLRNRDTSGAQLDSVCLHLLYKMTELNHISAVMDYKDVPERWTTMASRLGSLYTYARAGYIEEIDDKPHHRDHKSADGKQDRAHIEANMTSDSHERKLSYEFDTPKYHVMYKNVPISVPPLSTFPLLDASYYQMLQKRVNSRYCSVSGNIVNTFDNLTYTMPPVGDGCFKLIAKDCSPESNFIVLGAKVGSGKVVKVYLAQKFKVEFVPDKDGKKISDIKVNGETVSIEPNKPALKRDTKMGPNTVDAFTIENNGAFYSLNSKLYRFAVHTDGTWIFVQQSKYYDGKSCGICGDANGDHLLEFKSPVSPRRTCRSTNDFVWSYVLPSTCASRPANIECSA